MCARACVFGRSYTTGQPLVTGLDDTPRNLPPPPPVPPITFIPAARGELGPLTRGRDQPRSMRRARAPALRYLGLPPTRLSSSPSAAASPPPSRSRGVGKLPIQAFSVSSSGISRQSHSLHKQSFQIHKIHRIFHK